MPQGLVLDNLVWFDTFFMEDEVRVVTHGVLWCTPSNSKAIFFPTRMTQNEYISWHNRWSDTCTFPPSWLTLCLRHNVYGNLVLPHTYRKGKPSQSRTGSTTSRHPQQRRKTSTRRFNIWPRTSTKREPRLERNVPPECHAMAPPPNFRMLSSPRHVFHQARTSLMCVPTAVNACPVLRINPPSNESARQLLLILLRPLPPHMPLGLSASRPHVV